VPFVPLVVTDSSSAGQVLLGIHWPVIETHFVMQMWRGAAAGGSDIADHFALTNLLPHGHVVLGQVSVARRQPVAVIDNDRFP